ncbi:MAG: PLD nuclease N-terminal domain-containing protein [Dethiobacteria bacterium]|jgi:hypothetical protein|nr:PLD nuclease N-terminal domain-containing protein [Bacillota bacterium]NMD34149.1 PLDc_N domain-containing protein [Bacillota bacterium]HOB29744.1 PLD nuclease N-terminal domain-containing protein [Bacillota bacterium]HPZ41196.1 PLD nuclease N-terminal domain-containing protein [Bacillota bacterium]HQD52796.1 PLD nuclease N-terminal domain-containing protein [Bacillota bacterium]
MTAEIKEILLSLWPLFALELGLKIWALADLFRRNKVRWLPKFGWALIIILVNLFGSLAYLLFGREEA